MHFRSSNRHASPLDSLGESNTSLRDQEVALRSFGVAETPGVASHNKTPRTTGIAARKSVISQRCGRDFQAAILNPASYQHGDILSYGADRPKPQQRQFVGFYDAHKLRQLATMRLLSNQHNGINSTINKLTPSVFNPQRTIAAYFPIMEQPNNYYHTFNNKSNINILRETFSSKVREKTMKGKTDASFNLRTPDHYKQMDTVRPRLERWNKSKALYRDDKVFLPKSFELNHYTVVLGSKRSLKLASGNQFLLKLCKEFLSEYMIAKGRDAKSLIITTILTTVYDLCPNQTGAFVRKTINGRYVEVEDLLSREKISTELRNLLPERYTSANAYRVVQKAAERHQQTETEIHDISSKAIISTLKV